MTLNIKEAAKIADHYKFLIGRDFNNNPNGEYTIDYIILVPAPITEHQRYLEDFQHLGTKIIFQFEQTVLSVRKSMFYLSIMMKLLTFWLMKSWTAFCRKTSLIKFTDTITKNTLNKLNKRKCMDIFKDYLSALLGIFFLFISIILIPEIRAKTAYWIYIGIAIVILTYLGIDKINRDNRKENKNENQRLADSSRIANLSKDIKDIKKSDTLILQQIDSSLKSYHLKLEGNKVVPIITVNNHNINVTSNHQSGGQTAGTINNK